MANQTPTRPVMETDERGRFVAIPIQRMRPEDGYETTGPTDLEAIVRANDGQVHQGHIPAAKAAFGSEIDLVAKGALGHLLRRKRPDEIEDLDPSDAGLVVSFREVP